MNIVSALVQLQAQNLKRLPILLLRDLLIFPNTLTRLVIGRPFSLKAVSEAEKSAHLMLIAMQKDPAQQADFATEDIYPEMCVVILKHVATLAREPGKSMRKRVLVEGVVRAELTQLHQTSEGLAATFCTLHVNEDIAEPDATRARILALVNEHFDRKVAAPLSSLPLGEMLDKLAAQFTRDTERQRKLLASASLAASAELVADGVMDWAATQQIDREIEDKTKKRISRHQRDIYLQEKIRTIQGELNNDGDGSDGEGHGSGKASSLERDMEEAGLSDEARTKVREEHKKMRNTSAQSPEAGVIRNYLETIMALPWRKKNTLSLELDKVQKTLDKDHYGLDSVKERIMEHLAVQRRTGTVASGSILCLVGPPGVGKTSLAESIARATGRAYARIALGGVRDEAEIRGHRRTYIGAMPGKIIQKIKQVGSNNPLILLDEIDKMGHDFRGDPAAALLEVLDPEQNKAFADDYLDVSFDLSEVLFITTANSYQIPLPLLDRLEVIELSGYTDQEKYVIAKDYLLPKQQKLHGVKKGEATMRKNMLTYIVHHYTKEAGVRNLERQLAKLVRKLVVNIDRGDINPPVVWTQKRIHEFLGAAPFLQKDAEARGVRAGQMLGLAWNAVGGDVLTIEAVVMPGKGRLHMTGKLGEVMKESAHIGRTMAKYRHASLGIEVDAFDKQDVHVHVPAGAVPKDGPSAGLALFLAMVSALLDNPPKSHMAMTGEITLGGQVLAIGGLKQKLLAAVRAGVREVIIPKDNLASLADIPDEITNALTIHTVASVDEALPLVFSLPIAPFPTAFEGYAGDALADS